MQLFEGEQNQFMFRRVDVGSNDGNETVINREFQTRVLQQGRLAGFETIQNEFSKDLRRRAKNPLDVENHVAQEVNRVEDGNEFKQKLVKRSVVRMVLPNLVPWAAKNDGERLISWS